MYQIPDDAISQGWRETRPLQYEQVFSSVSANFTGTERQFIAAGHGYTYSVIDKHTRLVTS